jgi:hypothetical protein
VSEPKDIVDIDGLRRPQDHRAGQQRSRFAGRPWLAMKWKCCSSYSRIYKNREGTAYEGRCPRCGKPVRVPIAPNGTSQRFFEAE